jgi:hypothetical protein
MRHRHSSGPAHARNHINLRLERWHRRCIYLVVAELLLSGALWLALHFFLRPVGEFGESVHPLEPLAMKLHGAGAMIALFFLGSLMNSHIRRAIKAGDNLKTGWSLIVSLLVLIFSGYGLYYLAGEADRPAWSTLHWILGLALPVVLVLHIAIGRAIRQRRHASALPASH